LPTYCDTAVVKSNHEVPIFKSVEYEHPVASSDVGSNLHVSTCCTFLLTGPMCSEKRLHGVVSGHSCACLSTLSPTSQSSSCGTVWTSTLMCSGYSRQRLVVTMRFVPSTVHGRWRLDLWMSQGDACGKVWMRLFMDLNKHLFFDFETKTPTK